MLEYRVFAIEFQLIFILYLELSKFDYLDLQDSESLNDVLN